MPTEEMMLVVEQQVKIQELEAKVKEQAATIEGLEVTCLTYKLIIEEVRAGRLILAKVET